MKNAFESIKQGLGEALDYSRGNVGEAGVTKIDVNVDVKKRGAGRKAFFY